VLKQGNTVTVRPVTLTQQDDSRAVVATGLQAGEQVVTTGFARLTEGTQVAVSDAEDAGQIAPAGRPRPDGARGKRGSEKGKGSPSAGLPRTATP
jgi:membrane fusion protein, multidrug efflux system